MADPFECLRGIRRPTPLGAVWLSCRTHRGLIVLTLFVGIVFFLAAFFVCRSSDQYVSTEPSEPLPAPSENFFPGQTNRIIDWANLRSLWLHEPDLCKPLWTQGAIPRLESLTINSTISDQQMDQLCKLYNLKSLTLFDVKDLTADGFRYLANETQLEYLHIYSGLSLREEMSLDWPRNLRTLNCNLDWRDISLQRFEEWQRLPRLESLCTQRSSPDSDQLAEIIDVLERFPSLKRLYLLSTDMESVDVEFVQSELPKIRVRPSRFNSTLVKRAGTILIGGLIVILLISVQFSTYCLTTSSVLTPNFRRWHLAPVIGNFVVVVVASFFMYWLAGCSILIATGLSGTCFLVVSAHARLMRFPQSLGDVLTPGFAFPQLSFPIVAFGTSEIIFAIAFFGADIDWYLRGHQPWFSMLLSVVLPIGSLWAVVDLIRWQLGLARNLEAVGAGNAPLSMFDARGMNEWGRSLLEAGERRRTKPTYTQKGFDGRMERFLERLQAGRPAKLTELWRYGSMEPQNVDLRRKMMFMIFLAFLGTYYFLIFRHPTGVLMPGLVSVRSALIPTFMLGIFIHFMFAGMRIPLQPMELLRPFSRRDWIRIWFQWVATSMAPYLLFLVVLCLTSPWLAPPTNWSLTDACLAVTVGLAVVGIYFAVAMFCLTLNSLIKIAGITACTLGAPFVAVIRLAPAIDNGLLDLKTPSVLIPVIVGLYAIAYLGLRITWRRWHNWEVGNSTGFQS